MRKLIEFWAAVAVVVLAAQAGEAAAATHRHARRHYVEVYATHFRRPLPVERRSFLDPGTKVPVGYGLHYVYMPAYEWGDPVSTYQRSWFMDENLHQAFDPQPVGRFLNFGPFGSGY